MIQTIIVDDELLAGVGIKSLIDGKEDIKVSGVFSGAEEAVTFLREHPIDIVITDIEMSGMNGLELIQIIRKQHLADGVIILSCHDDFSYAQEAISKGTDSYLLKHCVSSDNLLEEIKKVYRKTHNKRTVNRVLYKAQNEAQSDHKDKVYAVSVVRILAESGFNIDSSMLVNLLEGVVNRYEMGTVFAPYNREIFIIFRFDAGSTQREVCQAVRSNLDTIRSSLQQYLSSRVLFGVSKLFTDLKQIHSKYDEAVSALEMSFYQPEKQEFFYKDSISAPDFPAFDNENFLAGEGVKRFEETLREYLHCAYLRQMGSAALKARLAQAIGILIDQILRSHRYSDGLINKWSRETELTEVVNRTQNAPALQESIAEKMNELHMQCLAELNADDLSQVFSYIKANLSDKLSLVELAEIACMSVPTFSKRFKERTGMTPVQYLNQQRIERAKALLKDSSLSLEQIAEETGFSGANYLIRVFKKVTGQTISEYRK